MWLTPSSVSSTLTAKHEKSVYDWNMKHLYSTIHFGGVKLRFESFVLQLERSGIKYKCRDMTSERMTANILITGYNDSNIDLSSSISTLVSVFLSHSTYVYVPLSLSLSLLVKTVPLKTWYLNNAANKAQDVVQCRRHRNDSWCSVATLQSILFKWRLTPVRWPNPSL